MKIVDNNNQKVTYERVTFSNKSHLGTSEEWGIFFASAMAEIATTKMKPLSKSLIILLMSHLADKRYYRGENKVELLTGKEYAEILQSYPSKITPSFQELEDLNFINRFKSDRCLKVTVNPAVAYRGKFRNYVKTHNFSASLFGNTMLKEAPQKIEEDQNWDSNLETDLNPNINHDM